MLSPFSITIPTLRVYTYTVHFLFLSESEDTKREQILFSGLKQWLIHRGAPRASAPPPYGEDGRNPAGFVNL